MVSRYRVVGISFEHMHMGDNLQMVVDHPQCELVGVCDAQPERMQAAVTAFGLSAEQVFTDWQHCISEARPDLIVLCPSTGDHALWVKRLAPLGLPLLIEKPMAASLADADAMIAACEQHDVRWAINWPLVWVPSHRTAKRLIDQGRIGEVLEVHYYGGNRGPLWHTAGKREITAEEVQREKPHSWFYRREAGGGSLLDYLGYGVTLGTWFMGGALPLDVTSTTYEPPGLEVDEHSITVVRYARGLSKFETRWGTYTDPWTHQPQPKCGFVIVGTQGTLSSYDYEPQVLLQDRLDPAGRAIPADPLEPPEQNPIQYFVDCLARNRPIEGPLSPGISRIGQQIVDAALHSAQTHRTEPIT
jgi:glucose-fructose oxidoreductase